MELATVNGIDLAEVLSKIAAGGVPSWIAAGVLSIVGFILMFFWKKQDQKTATKETEVRRNKDQADTLPKNQDASSTWEQAAQEVEDEREKYRKKLKDSPQVDEKKSDE